MARIASPSALSYIFIKLVRRESLLLFCHDFKDIGETRGAIEMWLSSFGDDLKGRDNGCCGSRKPMTLCFHNNTAAIDISYRSEGVTAPVAVVSKMCF